jgi:hypothetical protein
MKENITKVPILLAYLASLRKGQWREKKPKKEKKNDLAHQLSSGGVDQSVCFSLLIWVHGLIFLGLEGYSNTYWGALLRRLGRPCKVLKVKMS